MAVKHGLGRGLGALIKDTAPAEKAGDKGGPALVPVGKIQPSPWQPRRTFETEALAELAQSIREKGVLQPLLVRGMGDGYELIAGERRLRAAKEAGLTEVPVVLMEAVDSEALELAVIENVQREDLNAIEEAEAYRTLADKFGLTQEVIAQRVGKARASVTNAMRLLNLPAEVKQCVADGRLSAGHAKVLLGVEIEPEQRTLAQRVLKEGLSVRQLERIVERRRRPARARKGGGTVDIPASYLVHLTDRLQRSFGTAVRITPARTLANGRRAKGYIEIDYYSNEDLDRILEVLGLQDTGDETGMPQP